MAIRTCPICDRPFDPQDTRAMPFCSERCRLIDLARWLDERYGLPIEREIGNMSEKPEVEEV